MPAFFFFSIVKTAILGTLFGIAVNVILNDFGYVLAIGFYSACFAVDWLSTVTARNFKMYERNLLFSIMSEKTSLCHNLIFAIIFAVAIALNILLFAIISDPLFAYVLGMSHLFVALSNLTVSGRRLSSQKTGVHIT